MAQTYANNDNVLSKVKFGNTTYYIKDAAARAILDTFGNATLQDVALSIADGGTGLVTSDQVYDFVNRQIGAVGDILNLLSADVNERGKMRHGDRLAAVLAGSNLRDNLGSNRTGC